MSNRRMGGMGGPRGNRSFSQQPFQGGVNPWQGAPNNMTQGGIISTLTSNPQLALALTSLLQPQQQQMNNPPSLLSLNTSPAFSQDRDFGRFGNRGRDLRRHEPYNKNRGGWRPMDKNRRNQRDNKRTPNKDDKSKNEKKETTKKEKKDKDDTVDTIDLSLDEERDEKKRDWKDEKNQAESKDEESGNEDEPGKEPKNKEGKYTGVPAKYLNCFVCNKEMWDGESMDKHIRGRAHQQMMKSLEESIHITVNILRENMRLLEERKMIELTKRMHRLKKYGKSFYEPDSHCNMCDLKFMGKIVSHRRTEGHQRLKRYLHPNCHMCDKEFPSRMEWVEHRLTPDHLRKLHEVTENKVGGVNGQEITVGDGEDLNIEPVLEESLQMEVEHPILELDENIDGLQNIMPAYKRGRAVSTKSLKPFTGFMCELCNRSFADEKDGQDHLTTMRHFYKFVEAVREKYRIKERREREAAEKKAKQEVAAAEAKENGNGEEEAEEEGSQEQEMYDPEEVTNEEEASQSQVKDEVKEEDSKFEETEALPDSEVGEEQEEKLLAVKKEEEEEEVEEEEEEKEKEEKEKVEQKKVTRKAATPAAPKAAPASVKRAAAVKNVPAPKTKKLPATPKEDAAKPNMDTYRIPKKKAVGPARAKEGK